MDNAELDRLWCLFKKWNLDSDHPLRKGSNFKKALPFLEPNQKPAMPMKALPKSMLYDTWVATKNYEKACETVNSKPNLTFSELIYEMLKNEDKPYIWWLWPRTKIERIIYEDANGLTFVKLDNIWQVAYPVNAVGVLVGIQGTTDHETDVPFNSYFICSEYTEVARKHSF